MNLNQPPHCERSTLRQSTNRVSPTIRLGTNQVRRTLFGRKAQSANAYRYPHLAA